MGFEKFLGSMQGSHIVLATMGNSAWIKVIASFFVINFLDTLRTVKQAVNSEVSES